MMNIAFCCTILADIFPLIKYSFQKLTYSLICLLLVSLSLLLFTDKTWFSEVSFSKQKRIYFSLFFYQGVIGANSDAATVELAEYTTEHKIPLVTYIASTSRLSDGKKYPYLVRTVPAEKSLLSVSIAFLSGR